MPFSLLRTGLGRGTLLLLALLPAATALATDLPLDAVYPGALTDADFTDTHAFCTTYSGLLVLDIAAATPTVACFLPMPDDAEGIAVRGDLAYLAPEDVGLRILDISDPAAPHEVGTCPLPGGHGDVVLGPQHAYVADSYLGVRVFDISDPTAPAAVGLVTIGPRILDLDLDGQTLYAAGDGLGLHVIDVSDPTQPVHTGMIDVLGNICGVKARGDHLYLAAGRRGLRILNTGGEEIVEVGDAPLDFDTPYGTWCEDVALVGDRAFVTLSGHGLGVVDIGDPTAPEEIVDCELTGRTRSVSVRDGTAYAGCWNGGLQLVDVSDPQAPVPIAGHELLGMPMDVRAQDDLVYLAGGYTEDESKLAGPRGTATGGLYVLDLADPTRPEILGHCGASMMPSQIAVGGGRAYLSCSLAGVHIIDIVDPAQPQPIGQIPSTGAYFLDVEARDGIIFTSDEYDDIRSFDVSDPASPVQLDLLDGAYWSSFAVQGDLLFAAAFYGSLFVIDAADPSDLQILGSVDLPNYAESVCVVGDRAYVANGHRGLSVIDISDPGVPVELGVFDTPHHAYGVAVSGGLAYVADGEAGVRVIDVSDPAAMHEVAFNELASPAHAVAVGGDLVHVACSWSGLFVFERLIPTAADPHAPPDRPGLVGNYPNPFNPQTVITYAVSASGRVRLEVVDLRGRLIATLVDGMVAEGRHEVIWDGRDGEGREVPSGVYIARLDAGGRIARAKMALMR